MGTIIGIDLGTTNSVVAYVDRGEPKVIINEEGGRTTPSVVGFSKDGERFVGEIAKRQMVINPDSTVHSIKRFMGRRFADCGPDLALVSYRIEEGANGECVVPIGGRAYSPRELSAMVLQKLKKAAEDFLGEDVTEAVISVPAYFTDSQRQATRDAGTIAGLDVLRILNEPTAAALAYVHQRRRNSTIAVYDFGGGTFDVSILVVDRDVAEVKATRGDNALGGADLDQVLVRWMLDAFRAQHGMDVSRDRVVLQRLRDAAERAKLELSSATTTDVHLPFLVADASGPRHLQLTLQRDEFERRIAHLVDRTLDCCTRALEDAGVRTEQIDEVVMVGGTSRVPLVQRKVEALFGKPLNKGFNPDEVVAIGAAVQAGILEGEVKSVTLLDVTNFSLGIEVAGGRFAPLITKNCTLPVQKSRLVTTYVDNQRTVKIHVLQGEEALARDNVSLGEFELGNIQPAAAGAPRIRVTFSIDTSGIVSVGASDVRTGQSEQITIDAPTGMSRQELEQLRGEHQQHAMAHDLVLLRRGVEEQLVRLEAFLRDHQGLIPKPELNGAEQALKRGRMALVKGADRANLTQLEGYLKRVCEHLQRRV